MSSLTNRCLPRSTPAGARTAVLASPDLSFRQRVKEALTSLRWQVREASGGAEALAHLEACASEALILDSWLPDLEIREFVREFEQRYPQVELVTMDSAADIGSLGVARSPRRNELLHALRSGQDAATSTENESAARRESGTYSVPMQKVAVAGGVVHPQAARPQNDSAMAMLGESSSEMAMLGESSSEMAMPAGIQARTPGWIKAAAASRPTAHPLPEFIGENPCILEVSRRIQMVAARLTPVLVQGPTGTGKELVAKALHRLSKRSGKPLVVLNCAAIPEALLEAELFGHTRGAFTGAVQGRVGRIESAHGGTLFLDEIGEMPLALQAKLLRFVECGELQRIGENEPVRVDVRIVAATHQQLAGLTVGGGFRADLYYRLSVFMIQTPALRLHMEDLPLLAEHFLGRLGVEAPRKQLHALALERMMAHRWPGNVRELEHVLERGCILAEDRPEVGPDEIEFGDGAFAS